LVENMKRLVIALGGNALLPKGAKGTAEEQLKAAKKVIKQLEPILRKNQVVITHGNGPQVGNLLLQQHSTDEVPEMPLDVLDAMTQGQIGYFIASAISLTGLHSATLITRVVVNQNDPAFKNPTKPIGPFYKTKPITQDSSELRSLAVRKSWNLRTSSGRRLDHICTGNGISSTSRHKTDDRKLETGNHKLYTEDASRGYRLVVPSPQPLKIREHDAISALLERGFVVIAVGGGGIPIKNNGMGLEAVIDKDFATSLLATQIKADTLVFITSIDAVYLNFGKESQKRIARMTLSEAKKYLAAGHFAVGSMKPKIESSIRFLEHRGQKVIITSFDNISASLNGKKGTTIVL
jgi:carbamate kinase